MSFSVTSGLGGSFSHASRTLSRWFPLPELLAPQAAGIDISDASVKWLALEAAPYGARVTSFGEAPLPAGAVVSGVVHDIPALAAALREARSHLGHIRFAHGALPEEAAYVFSMSIPHDTPRQQVLRLIEFEFEGRVPIPPAAAVYDYTLIPTRDSDEQEEISVAVFPQEIAESYVNAFDAAGITLLSLEVEARSIARAVVSSSSDEPVTLVVDFGRARTGFTVLKRGMPIFTSTVEVGGESMMRSLVESVRMTPEEATRFKNTEGLHTPSKNTAALEAIYGTASALADEIARHFHYWDTRRDEKGERMTPVGKVVLVGGHSNLAGLADYIAGKVQAPVELGQCWRNVAHFNDYIPPIDRGNSLQFGTAIGLALRAL